MMHQAKAIHLRDEENRHAVMLGHIRVLVRERHGEWFAQGIEVDYAASGESMEDVQSRFERGLAATVHVHLRRFSSLDRLLKFAPRAEVEKLDADEYQLNLVSIHDIGPDMNHFPFGRIAYLEESRVPA